LASRKDGTVHFQDFSEGVRKGMEKGSSHNPYTFIWFNGVPLCKASKEIGLIGLEGEGKGP